MIKSLIAVTREIDDPKAALGEIINALDLEKNLLKNSLGIITCFSEFEETGVLKTICDALPFDCIGSTTCLCASGQDIDQILLTVTVLTSDECSFKSTVIPISGKYEDSINSSISALLAQFGEKPALLLSYFPLMNTVSGDMILSAIDRATGGIPLFGTTTVDHKMDYSSAKTIRNGEAFRESAVLAAVCGAVNFSFEIASINEDKIWKQKAVITESQGNLLMGVNGEPALDYLEKIGLTKTDIATGLGVLPLVLDHKDGTKPVARAVFTSTPEGYAVCGGAMPKDVLLSLGRIDMEDVLYTTEKALGPLAEKNCLILSYSCIARYLVLGTNTMAEAEKVKEVAGDTKYLYACSGGEICPLPDADGKLKNYYHNYTNVFCKIS